MQSKRPRHVYEVRPRKDKRGVGLISDVLPFGRLWFSDQPVDKNRCTSDIFGVGFSSVFLGKLGG
jgi:hypothetical protein